LRELKKRSNIENLRIMKNKFKILAIALTLGFIFGLSNISIPQPPPPSGHGQTGDATPSGGGAAPIGSGLIIMLGMGAAYGSKKLYKGWKNLDE
jgi:hypothetical protein